MVFEEGKSPPPPLGRAAYTQLAPERCRAPPPPPPPPPPSPLSRGEARHGAVLRRRHRLALPFSRRASAAPRRIAVVAAEADVRVLVAVAARTLSPAGSAVAHQQVVSARAL